MPEINEQRARESIATYDLWHHRIEVAPGVVTPGRQDTAGLLAQIGMPADLSGMRVLDIGARDGFFTFEAERRGAAEVIAVDNVGPDETGFGIAADLLGSRAQFVVDNVYRLDPAKLGRFDLVLFLGVLYHLRHPLLALDRIFDVTEPEATMLLETHLIDEGLVDADGRLHALTGFHQDLPGFPLAQYFPGAVLNGDYTNQWAPNSVALAAWLRASGFEPDSLWQVGSRGGAVARRSAGSTGRERLRDEMVGPHAASERP